MVTPERHLANINLKLVSVRAKFSPKIALNFGSPLEGARNKLKIKTEVNTAPDYVQYLALPKKDDQSSSGQVSSSNSGRSLDSPRTPNQVQNKECPLEGFHFRWLKTKEIDLAISISIMLYFNHLK